MAVMETPGGYPKTNAPRKKERKKNETKETDGQEKRSRGAGVVPGEGTAITEVIGRK